MDFGCSKFTHILIYYVILWKVGLIFIYIFKKIWLNCQKQNLHSYHIFLFPLFVGTCHTPSIVHFRSSYIFPYDTILPITNDPLPYGLINLFEFHVNQFEFSIYLFPHQLCTPPWLGSYLFHTTPSFHK